MNASYKSEEASKFDFITICRLNKYSYGRGTGWGTGLIYLYHYILEWGGEGARTVVCLCDMFVLVITFSCTCFMEVISCFVAPLIV